MSTIPTPPMSPSTSRPVTSQWSGRMLRAASDTGPVMNASNPSCSGPATVVVIKKTAHITARNRIGPSTGCSTTRSTRWLSGSPTFSWLTATFSAASKSAKRWSTSALGRIVCGSVCIAFATAPSSASRFSRRRPLTLTTGMPTTRDSAEVSMLMPCCLATSSLVTPTTTRYGYSAIWNARLSPRAGAVASTNTTTTSGRSHGGHSTSISRVNSSSGLIGSKE